VAVSAAGSEGKRGPVTEQSAESYAATFDTNVLGTLLSMKHELRVMLPQGHGSIAQYRSVRRRASLRAGCTIGMLLDLTIWPSLQKTDRTSRKCTIS
jgi:NAD(P)-dependent dehydrogenase (short-subunit alcohol dehydrogenase family)